MLMSMVRAGAGAVVRGVLVGALAWGGMCAWGQGSAAQVPAGQVKPAMTLVEPPAPLLPSHPGALQADMATFTHGDQTTTFAASAGCRPDMDQQVRTVPESPGVPCEAILKEDGLVRSAAANYGPQINVFALEFVDATAAESAYTFYRMMMKSPRIAGAQALGSKLAAETSTDADGTLVWAGTTIVRVTGRIATADLQALLAGLPKVSGRKGVAPLLPTLLPVEAAGIRLEANSVRYAIGPTGYRAMQGVLPPEILGWDKAAEIATATYAARNGGSGTLTLLLYPTPQIAADRGRAIEKAINDKGVEGANAAFGMVKLRRVGPLVGMASGGLTAEQAEKLVQALHLNEEVSLDKPMPLNFQVEVRKTATLLQSIALFTGLLILAAVVIGVFLGGGRALVRRLQGKSAASEPEFLTINLRGKPRGLFAAEALPKEESAPPKVQDEG
jgi:hypothetical protein